MGGGGHTSEKGGFQALGEESERNRKDLPWFLRSTPLSLAPSEIRRVFWERSGKGTNNPTEFQQQPRKFRAFWLLFSKVDKHVVNGNKKKEAHIIIHQHKFLNTVSFLCSGLIADFGPFLSPGAIPAFSLLEAFQPPTFPSALSALRSSL